MECATRAICELPRRWTAIATASVCSVLQTLHNDTVAIAVRRWWLAICTPRAHHADAKNWRSHGVREACD
eukprot:8196473-Lingulodinium_polyedra.AAC.1